MLQAIEQMIFRNVTPLSIRYLAPPGIARAGGLCASVYRQLELEFQTVPPVTMHHLDPELMAGVWSACRETLVAGPGRDLKEAVAIAVSESNRCPYCVQAHTSFLEGSGGEAAENRELMAWAAATGMKAAVSGGVPPVPRALAPAIMGTAVLFHYINRMANLFLDETMMPVIGKVPLLRDPALRFFGSCFSARIASLEVSPGVFLTPEPLEPLPDAFGWALDNREVAGGLRRFAAAASRAGASLDPGVRELAGELVGDWNGEVPGPGKGWLDSAVAGLPEELRPQARVALLAARASWAFDDREVLAFRRVGGDDRALLDTAAWGAYMATQRIAGWFAATR
ncbi:MAG: carboxymuconolactone decarboxylase family protein [Chlorobiaceae bacterium]|nr:carboxymuconolactone decarboxylase family protein [Chlorobiaceae bacterium]NTW74637.1 carboxymuconolactone decarboxylase family protein [Chlorobiaceae bacterium]